MSNREAHLLDRVRETAKRCIDLGVRVDIPGHNFTGKVAWDAYRDFCDATDAALFQLAEVAGSGDAVYTEEDVEASYSEGYSDGKVEGYEEGFDDGYRDGVEASAPE
jgi:hypothetical protein